MQARLDCSVGRQLTLVGAIVVLLSGTASAQSKESQGWGSRILSPLTSWKAPEFSMPEMKLPEIKTPSLSLPELPKPKEPAFVKSTRQGMGRIWDSTTRTTKQAWESTKYYLRPYDPPEQRASRRRSRAEQDTGFWASLFGGSDQKRATTPNDFLRQPRPL